MSTTATIVQTDPLSECLSLLRAPFPPEVVKWRPGTKTKDGTKALALAYVDARDVMERLDDAVGPQGWSDRYKVVDEANGVVECTLAVQYPDLRAVSKSDVGYPNGGMDDDEPFKGAYSDAFKRAAVKYGIGRDLYDTPKFWIALDEYKHFPAIPQWVEGKGWVAPGEPRVVADPVAPEALRRKMFARFGDVGLTPDQAKAEVFIVVGKQSTKGLTVAEVEKIIDYLDEPGFVESLKEVESVVGTA